MRINNIKKPINNQIQDKLQSPIEEQGKNESSSLGVKKVVGNFFSRLLTGGNHPKTPISESDLEKLRKEGKDDTSRTHDR